MKKETTIIANIELTKILKGDTPVPTAEILESSYKQMLNAHTYDDAHINVKIFESEKEEISTEKLILAARLCHNPAFSPEAALKICEHCHYYCEDDNGSGKNCWQKLSLDLADRLEELHNQQTATPTETETELKRCQTCDYMGVGFGFEPCRSCNEKSKWQQRRW